MGTGLPSGPMTVATVGGPEWTPQWTPSGAGLFQTWAMYCPLVLSVSGAMQPLTAASSTVAPVLRFIPSPCARRAASGPGPRPKSLPCPAQPTCGPGGLPRPGKGQVRLVSLVARCYKSARGAIDLSSNQEELTHALFS